MNSESLSPELLRELVQHCPVGILTLTRAGTIGWINPALEQMLGAEASALRGRDPLEMPREDLQGLFSADTTVLVRHPAGGLRRLARRRVVTDRSDPELAEIHYYADESETARLAQETEALRDQLDQLSLRDATTGLMNERALMLVLEPQVSRSRRYEAPLSVILLHVASEPDPADASASPERAVSRVLRDQLRWADLVGRDESGDFVIVLPETGRDAAGALADKVARALREVPGVAAFHFGISEWIKRDTAASLLHRAGEAMARARADGTQALVAG